MRPASLSAVFIPSALRSGRAGLVSYHGFGWQHAFQFVGTGFSIYHGLPQSFGSLLENNSFSSAILRSPGHSGRSTPVAVYSLEAGVHAVFSFREVEGVDTQPVDIVIDMFDASYILSRCRRHCCRFGKCCIASVPKRNREISWSGNFFRRGL